jgi:MoaA/NifB/PqqE/SkfB family radical SAM enzyme
MFDLSAVKTLQIELTNQCNAACPACAREIDYFQFDSKLHRSEFTLDQFKHYFNKEFLRQLTNIEFAGTFGDPIMAKDVYDIITYIKKSNPILSISINTNGSIRDTNWWAKLGKLMQFSKDVVVWSIDGLEDTNNIYRINTNWDKIISNAKSFIDAGGHAHWAMLMFDYNEHQVDDCEQYAKQLGFESFICKVSGRHITKEYNIVWDKKPKNYNFGAKKENVNITCAALLNKAIYITAHGEVLPCCHYGSKIYLDKIVDNYPNLIVKNKLDSPTIQKTIDSFNELEKTWTTDAPADVCLKNCNFAFKDSSDYRWVEQKIVRYTVFN